MSGLWLSLPIGEPLALAFLALAADLVLRGLPVIGVILDIPILFFAAMGGWFDRRLNRAHRSAASRRVRGGLVAVLVAAFAAAIGWAVAEFARSVPNGWGIELAALICLIVQRRAFDAARHVRGALLRHQPGAARAALARAVRYDTDMLDDHAVARGAVETSAVTICDGVIGPIFWYLLLGLPGMCAYRAINVLAGRISHPVPARTPFGAVAAALDRLLNYMPAPLAGAVVVLAAIFVPGARPFRAARTMLRDFAGQPTPAAGWAGGAMAGALGLALGGPRIYGGAAGGAPWVGDGRARVTAGDIGRALYMQIVAVIVTAGAIAAAGVAWAAG